MLIEQGTNCIELEISSPAPGSKARRVSVGLRAGDFQAVRAEVWVEPGEFEAFLQDLHNLEKSRKGKAALSAASASTHRRSLGFSMSLRSSGLLPNMRLKLTARVDCGMNLFSARRSLSAIR